MVLYILRGAFILLVTSVALLYVLPFQEEAALDVTKFVIMTGVTISAALAVIAIDVMMRQKGLSAISGVFLGLLAGLLGAYALSFVVDLIGLIVPPPAEVSSEAYMNLLRGVKVFIGLVMCYLAISFIIQTKDDFRFVIPYVEFAREIRGNRPMLLDTSVIIDGRILDIVATNVMQGTLVIPRFVLNELQQVADSADKLRRARGRRGLDILQKLQSDSPLEIVIDNTDPEGANVDQKLVSLAQALRARIMTNDFNLAKIAMLRSVEVINLNDLAKAMRPVVLPGEGMLVKVVKPGEGATQGVGYLDDGTMVVVENARQYVGQEVQLVVTSTLQTSAGRMIFGRAEGDASPTRERAGADVSTDDAAASGARPIAGPTVGRNPRRT